MNFDFEHIGPGDYICVVAGTPDADAVGFHLRHFGFEIRNTVTIMMPGRERLAILARQSSDHTVADMMVRYGTGSIHIDACRISLSDYDLTEYIPNRVGYKDGINHIQTADVGARKPNTYDLPFTGQVFNTDGRFPANLLLVHGSSCRLGGIREVKTRTDTRPEDDAGRSSTAQWRYTPTSETKRGYGGADGVEKVPEWDCQPDCPVHLLDCQTGDLGHSFRTSRDHQSGMMGWQAGNTPGYQDSGGASRFFHQSKSRDELEIYLGLLVGGYDHVYWLTNE